ncbi:uncharacterized protein PV07_01808 [Cladophialophora immunda]|uniref:Uncharacterized protein n=1 Tax=Cladophialophora immunda TaxID=569365 RepID=A0A0D2CVG0_9EURO|nr:uncharacterized protein PV07_01808 [Cladophialophora immunda]KIW35088.1 hypothetical protein PV07_01808 [Cladophialophora immunda]
MADPKNDTIMFEYGEGSPGKQHHHDLTGSLLTTTNSPGDYPIYSAPRPDFLSVFNRVAPFVDGLRESGILDRYDYARLRMTCKTTAQELKPYPYDRTEADTKDPYFAGVQAIPCDDCGIPSDRLVVKPCHGLGTWKSEGGFSGCGKLVCTYCVMFAQGSRWAEGAYELHYCRPCGWRFHRDHPGARTGEPCRCDFKHGGDVVDQPDSQWQCESCRRTLHETLSTAARDNLMALEAERLVFVRDHSQHPFAGGSRRWINDARRNRNFCPGCGVDYLGLIRTWEDSDWDGIRYPHDMVRQCMACLEPKWNGD